MGDACTPVVSVVIPAYNAAVYLSAAVSSILGQSWRDLELIVVDDGSSDQTRDVLARFSDPRLRVIRHSVNRGMTAARNTGLREARGRYVAAMDSDDVAKHVRIERQVRFFKDRPDVVACGGAVELIDEAGVSRGVIKRHAADPTLAAWSTLFLTPIVHPTLMIRRDVFERVGWYDESDAYGEDYGVYERLIGVGRIANLPDVLLWYRVSAAQATSRHADRQRADAERIGRRLIESVLAEPPRGYDLVRHERIPYRSVSPATVAALRGLALGAYPRDPVILREVGALLVALVKAFESRPDLRALYAPLQPMYRDASARLWLLSALALRRGSITVAGACVRRAIRLAPIGGLTTVAGKLFRKG